MHKSHLSGRHLLDQRLVRRLNRSAKLIMEQVDVWEQSVWFVIGDQPRKRILASKTGVSSVPHVCNHIASEVLHGFNSLARSPDDAVKLIELAEGINRSFEIAHNTVLYVVCCYHIRSCPSCFACAFV